MKTGNFVTHTYIPRLVSLRCTSVEERILSHGQLMTESPVTEPKQDSKGGMGPEFAQGLGGSVNDYNESNKNNQEGQDLNQDLEKKSDEQWDSEKKSQEQHD